MPNETLITDLVAQQAMDQLAQLDRAMEGTLTQFQNCARELAQGLKIPVEVTGDVEALRTLTNTVMRDAQQATQQLTQQLQQQQQVVANTTNTISRQLQAQENLNKAQREAFQQDQQAQQLANALLGTRQQNYELLARYTAEMKANKDAQKQVNEQEKQGLITAEQAIQKRATLMAAYDKTKFAAAELTKILAAENKEANAVQGSYAQLSQKLERLKMAYKQMTDAQKASAGGKELEAEIQNLDAHLKDLAADMGEHQRNVGNYAIAAQSMKSSLRELTEEIAQLTMQYNDMSSSEQQSDIGIQLREKIAQLTEEAGKYKDVIADVKESIKGSASDTRWFDTMIQSGQLMVATFGLAKNAALALGYSEESLQKSMLGVQRAMQAVQALQVIQNSLQKQSNIMKGIGILQSKALAAATALEAKATASATGATVAQTVAMKAFNAVAKANPYVLLATAIIAVIGLIVAYTTATDDATEADKEAAEAAKLHADSVESMSQTYSQAVAEPLVKLQLLRDQWNALGNDLQAKRQFIVQHKSDLEAVADAAGIAKSEVANVNGVERVLVSATGSITTAIKKRAEGMAAYAEMIRLTQLKLQEIDKVWANAKFANAKAGQKVGVGWAGGGSKGGVGAASGFTDAELKAAMAGGGTNYGGADFGSSNIVLNQKGAEIINQMRYKMVQDAAVKQTREIEAKFDKEIDARAKQAVSNMSYKASGFTPAPVGGGGGSSSNSRRGSSSKGSRGSGRSTTTKAEKQEQAKDEKELQDMLLEVLIDANKRKTKIVEEYSEEWAKLMKEGLVEMKDKDIKENKEKYQAYMEDLNKSLKLGKIDQDKYNKLAFEAQEVYIERGKAIQQAYAEEVTKVDEDMAKHKVETLEKENEDAIEQINEETAVRLNAVNRRYQGELALAKGNTEEIERIRADHAKEVENIEQQSAMRIAQQTIDTLERQVAMEKLSDEEREEIAKKLAEAKRDLDNMVTENLEKTLDEQVQAEKDAADKIKEEEDRKKELAQEWIDTITDGIGKVAEFMDAMYDNQISKVQELIDEEQARYEAEVNHIDWLADRGAITTEEAEIRKRDAAERTAKAQEALEKRKAALEYKKAVVEKANSVAQAAIATALAVTKALPNIALAAVVGALGAVQIATILAQPIQKYAEGTKGKGHPGGLAVVGDGGRSEVVMYGNRAWITPDSPTLVDLPRGAQVLPDADKVDLVQMGSSLFMSMPRNRSNGQPIIVNDYEALEGRMVNNTKAVTQSIRHLEGSMRRQFKRSKFNAYIARRV